MSQFVNDKVSAPALGDVFDCVTRERDYLRVKVDLSQSRVFRRTDSYATDWYIEGGLVYSANVTSHK
jgi:hypothetical protein